MLHIFSNKRYQLNPLVTSVIRTGNTAMAYKECEQYKNTLQRWLAVVVQLQGSNNGLYLIYVESMNKPKWSVVSDHSVFGCGQF